MPSSGEDMAGIPPDEMGCFAVRIEHKEILSLGVSGEHASTKAVALLFATPAVEEDESRTIRGVKQVIEPMLGAGRIIVGIRDPGGRGQDPKRITSSGLGERCSKSTSMPRT